MEKCKSAYTQDTINCEDLVFGIETDDDGTKIVHLYGYGYDAGAGESEAEPCRFVEYTFFYVPLTEVLERGIFNVESEDSEPIKQYITDCTYEGMLEMYRHYDNGNCPTPITEKELSMELKEGVYVVHYEPHSVKAI